MRVGARQLTLSNLEKVLYPRHGFTAAGQTDGVTRFQRPLADGGGARPAWVNEMAFHDA